MSTWKYTKNFFSFKKKSKEFLYIMVFSLYYDWNPIISLLQAWFLIKLKTLEMLHLAENA